MNKVFLTCLLACLTYFSQAQSSYWVMFSNKGMDADARLANASQYFSPQAQALRAEKGISYTHSDLPVSSEYLNLLQAQGIQILATSKWLNAAAVKADPTSLETLKSELNFVVGYMPCATFRAQGYGDSVEEVELKDSYATDYGEALFQAEMINVLPFHEEGYTGKGIKIAVFDGGFPGVDKLDAFKTMRDEGRILATYDFVENEPNVYRASNHGTQVLSCIGADLPGKMVGTAPDASFVLCRTEDARTETKVEEYNFLRGVEWADSVGVDIIHASLGYTDFDGGIGDYTYDDLDGDKAIVTRAVDLAASKGILVTISAGNEGNGKWHYIAAPCDADSVLCVGSVDRSYRKSGFSSFGPTADGRIRPDVMALGSRTTVFTTSNRVGANYGTSFSGPIMAGFMACLKQANPDADNMQLIQAARLSGDQAGLPDNSYGYGIPDLVKADSFMKTGQDLYKVKIVQKEKPQRGKKPASMAKKKKDLITKNPQTVLLKSASKIKITVPEGVSMEDVKISTGGKEVSVGKNLKVKKKKAILKTTDLNKGRYIMMIKTDKYKERIRFTI
ncbi:MAG: S8 family serine peptidase [Bacteroidia bacterium]|nr:S8 family serine peptidase [Bacteroidia bacterium]